MVALAEFAVEDPHRQWVQDKPLDRALERPRAVCGIVPFSNQPLFGGVGHRYVNLPILEPAQQPFDLNVDNRLQLLAIERMEDDDLVAAVDELGPEVRAKRVEHLTLDALVD